MKSPLAFEGELAQLPYAIASTSVFCSQHLAVAALFAFFQERLVISPRFFLLPLSSIADINHVSPVIVALAFAFMLLILWTLAALAFRRARSAVVSGWIAATVAVPIIQIFAIAGLSVLPVRSSPIAERTGVTSIDYSSATEGMLAGAAVTLFTVVVGTLIFGASGYGLFVLGPLLIGATTAFLANRRNDIGSSNTAILVVGSIALGGAALVGIALEGVLCIVLAAPLAIPVALLGSALGRMTALSGQRRARQPLMSVALLPLAFFSEQAFPPSKAIDTVHSIDIAAPADAVWRSLIHMDAIDIPPSLPFRLGIAYPVSARFIGHGVGARRLGVFSTGVAVERVTAWTPDRVLAFMVVTNPPAMKELSPYRRVNAPHVQDYFQTTTTRFELLPLASGGTRLILRSAHELKLDPVLYWLPLARWVVGQDNARVLAYVRRRSERAEKSTITAALHKPPTINRV